MNNYQILLLPKHDYWDWVRASRSYVLKYGLNLTNDVETAARYMAPAQVISFPVITDGFSGIKDMERWLINNHSGIRLDPIPANSPRHLEAELTRRLAENDRYGQKRKPFYLLWPTQYVVITQKFGANPQIYGRWGMPGHEGLDIRALTNTNIYSCANGEVYRVHTNPKSHPYGIHVRIRHKSGYKTVYGHLARAFVGVGQRLSAGDVIGKADSTGASVGAHLHLTLKRDGATRRHETKYPKDIVDPTGLMVWPQRVAKTYDFHRWHPDRCLFGAFGSVDGQLSEDDLRIIESASLEALMVLQSESNATIEHLQRINPAMFMAVRAMVPLREGAVDPRGWVEDIQADVGRLYRMGLRYFSIHSKPNLQSEGWRRNWHGGREFGEFFTEVARKLRDLYPDIRIGFPELSSGTYISGWQESWLQFLTDAEEAIDQADWMGVCCHWQNAAGMRSLDQGRIYEQYLLRFPEKLLMITEFSNPSEDVAPETKAAQYIEYYQSLVDERSVGAAFAFAISAEKGYDSTLWRRFKETNFLARIAERSM